VISYNDAAGYDLPGGPGGDGCGCGGGGKFWDVVPAAVELRRWPQRVQAAA
jgi:hypothetical protein